MIELDDFIAEALTSIVQGIRKGQESAVGDHIAPLIKGKDRNAHGNFHLKGDDSNQATIVQFDVQVATELNKTAGGSAKGKVRLFVVNAELGGEGNFATKASNLHRLQFAIPVKIPKRRSKGTSLIETAV
jgi:hypothetical protein